MTLDKIMFARSPAEPSPEQHLDEDGDALQLVPASDWVRLWANLRAKHLPEALAREIQLSITQIAVNAFAALSALGLVATTIIVVSVVPLSTPMGLTWVLVHAFEYLLITATVIGLRRRRRNGTLTSSTVNRAMLVPVVLAGVLWGALPTVVGFDHLEVFYLATIVSASFCSVGFFWTLGHWPLSMAYATIILGLLMWSYARVHGVGSEMIVLLSPVLLAALFGISVVAQVALVHSRYYQVTARDREQMIRLILQDYERGGHDFSWDTDSDLRLTHVPRRMSLAGCGDRRVVPSGSLLDLLADAPTALAAVMANQPFQARVPTEGPDGRGELRLWGRPKLVRGEALGYSGVGSDEDAARRAAEADRIGERLDAMVTLTSGLAHDFNNQLATVLGAIELATLEPDLPESTQSYLHRAVDACLRTRRITADLVVASGYDATYQAAPFELGAAATEVAEDLQPLFPSVHIVVRSDMETWVVADRSHYVRALRNLMQNACQAVTAGPSHRRRVITHTHAVEAGGPARLACTDVRDFGTGVPAELGERIFEPFTTTRREDGGNGLGLSVARGFARQAGGTLTLEPAEPGASFRLLIPLAVLAHYDAGAPAKPELYASSTPLRLAGRFLVVEDERQVADNIATLLRSFGAEAEVANTLAEAIDRFAGRTQDVECVISDLLLPDGEGYEVIAALRRHDPNLRAIYMSGFTSTLPANVAAELQCPFLAKPFSSTELTDALLHAGVKPAASASSRP